ncbi:YadA-like family protein [Eikenella sp. Marseille-P7795]|uniref:YadA-like family protein n=1 Tax=Eikenella sp. Marseille-P7795 TaxID=2866577 RepID=UPI001CE40E03|nr:YadA-like family protein [Eikenella sp. Marseille-P7795]
MTITPAGGGKSVSLTTGGLNNGGNKITNVANGTADTDAVNFSQLQAMGSAAKTHYYSVNSTETGADSNYNNDGATGVDALAAGVKAKAEQRNSVAIGNQAQVVDSPANLSSGSIAIGDKAKAQGDLAVALGAGATVSGESAAGGIAIGAAASSNNGGMAVGSGANAGNGTAMIPGLPVRLNNNVALGDSAKVKDDTNFNVALGSFSIAGETDLTATPYKPTANAVVAGVAEAGVQLGEVSVGGDNTAGMGQKLYRRVTNVAAGAADTDAVNVSQLKAAQAAATSKVEAGDGITVTSKVDNTTGSTTYTVAADTTALTVGDGNNGNPVGKVIEPTGADANKLATAGDIAKAINNSGFQATAGGNLASGSTATPTTVKPGQKVTFAAGDGLTVKQDVNGTTGDQTYTYALNAQAVVQNAQTPVVYTKADGSKVYKHTDGNFYDAPNGAGNQVAAGDVIASMQSAGGSTTAPTKLANVAAGTANTDAVNVSQLKGAADALGGGAGIADGSDPAVPAGTFIQPSYSITKTDGTTYPVANNVGTALSNLNAEVVKPITFAGDSGADSARKLGEKLTIKGGVTDANKLTDNNIGIVSDGNGTLTAKLAQNIDLGDNGSVKTGDTKMDNSGITIAAPTPTNPANTVSLTKDGLNNGGNKITNVANGAADTDAVNVSQLKAAQAAATSKVEAGDGSTATSKVDNTTGSTTYTVAADTTALTVGDGNNGNPVGKVIEPTGADANKLATAGDIAKAINNSGFQATAGGNLASGSTATPTTVKPGQKVTFAAGDGLTVKQDVNGTTGDQTYTYALNAQAVVQNAQTPVVYTKADGSKVYKHTDGNFYDAPNGAGNQVAAGDVIASMQSAGGSTTAPTKLANVAAGTANTDAVNVSQLKGAADALGGGAGIADGSDPAVPAGTFIQPSYSITKTDGTTYPVANNVGTALSNLNAEVVKPITFAGDSGADSARKLGEKLTIKGGVTDANKLTDNNIGIVSDGNGTLTAKLAQNIDLGDNGSVKTGDTKMDNSGITIAAPTPTNPANTVSLTKDGLNNGGNKITNVANGAADTDAVNVSQLKAAQAAATSKVEAGDGITGTSKEDNTTGSTTYTVAADTTALTVGDGNNGNPVGKVIEPTGADANKLATAGDIAKAINNSGFQATAGGNLASGSTATPTTVKPGQKVTFAAGDGLTVKQDVNGTTGDQTYTYALNAQAVVQNAQTPVVYTKADGSKVYKHTDGNFYDAPNGAGNQVAAGDVIASMQSAGGSTTAPTTLGNVKSNLADASTVTTNPTGNDRATLTANGKGNNAATVNDVLNAGFTVQGNGTDKDFVTHGDTINFVNGQGTVAKVNTTGGVTEVKFDTPLTYVDPAGQASNAPSNKVNLVGVAAGDAVTLGNVADGNIAANSKDAVNGGQLHTTNQNVANNATNIAKGINFGGTTGSNNYQLGQTINVTGDDNITSTTVTGGAKLALNPNLSVTSVTTKDAAGNQTVTNGSGVTIIPAAAGSSPVSLTTGGLDNGGNKITNVGAGTNPNDAVNVGQLNQALGAISGSNNANIVALDAKVNDVANTANAGVAQAIATAGLPQAYLPGKNMVAVGGGYYKGETGYAIGFSTISDNGNWIIKATGSGNSRGNFGGSIGAGYQW